MMHLDYRNRLKEDENSDGNISNKLNIHEKIVWFIIKCAYYIVLIVFCALAGTIVVSKIYEIFLPVDYSGWYLLAGPVAGAVGYYIFSNGYSALDKLGILEAINSKK